MLRTLFKGDDIRGLEWDKDRIQYLVERETRTDGLANDIRDYGGRRIESVSLRRIRIVS